MLLGNWIIVKVGMVTLTAIYAENMSHATRLGMKAPRLQVGRLQRRAVETRHLLCRAMGDS